jgi:type I restriction enzyme S subunit
MPKLEIGEQIRSNKFLLTEKVVLLSKLNPHIPRIWFPCIRGEYRSICSTEFLVISPFQENSCQYLYSLFSSQIFLDLFSSLVTGTSGSHQRVKPEYLVNLDILSPPQKLISQFTQITKSAFERVNYSLFESKTLRDTRDTLLPKLLSGEIRIKDAEKVVEEVA